MFIIFGPKHIYRLQHFPGFEGSVSQGNVYIKSTFKGSHRTSEILSQFTKQKNTVGYMRTCYSTEFHISVMQEHSEILPY